MGEAVVVKAGVKDPDFDVEIGGWQGRILDVYEDEDDPPTLLIEWDSLTLKARAGAYFERCVAEQMDWAGM